VRLLNSGLRRFAAPAAGICVIAVIVAVVLLVLQLSGGTEYASASVPVIHIGGSSTGQGQSGPGSPGSSTVTTMAATTATPEGGGSGDGSGTETSGTADQGGSKGTGSTIQSGKTTIVTNEVHVGRGPASTGGAEHPSATGQGR
jgi:hypothetical protein